MNTPLVSIGIPFLNCEDCLLDSVRSIFAQTYTNWELILVDDGSTDDSLKIAQSVDDKRVRVLPSDGRNRRLPARLNQIIQAARGEYIARMDADDLSHPNRLARQVGFLESHKEVDVLGTSAYIVLRQVQPVGKLIMPTTHNVIARRKFKTAPVIHPSVMARSAWFRRYLYDETNIRNEDYELWMRSFSESIFHNLPELLYLCDAFTFFSLSKYVKTKHSGARTIWRYASREVGRLAAAYYSGRRYAQIIVYAACTLFGLDMLLVRKRYSPLTSEECADAKNAIDIIVNTEMPLREAV